MNILIVEDSRLARNELRELLKHQREYTIVGEASTVAEATQLIETLKPDLLLLDIHLPDGDGFSLLEQLQHLPLVVFTTAYDQHAVSAFEVNALDYLLKPIEKQRLLNSLARASQTLASHSTNNSKNNSTSTLPEKIFIRDGDQYHFVQLQDIIYFEVDGNYTRVYCQDKRPLLARSLNYLEQRLPPERFFRANRQIIINLDCVTEVEPWVNDGLQVTLCNSEKVDVSRRQTKALIERLEV